MRCVNPNAHLWRYQREVIARGDAAQAEMLPGYCPWCYQPNTDAPMIAKSPLLTVLLPPRGRAIGRARVQIWRHQ